MGKFRPTIKHTIDSEGNEFWEILGFEKLRPHARGDFDEQLRRLAHEHQIDIIESR